MEVLAIVKEVVIIVLVASASILCLLVIVGLVKLFPHLRRLVENLEGTTASTAKIASDLAGVSADVATDVKNTTSAAAMATKNLEDVTASAAKIAGDMASVSIDVTNDVRKTTAAAAEASENLAITMASTAKVATDLAGVSADVASNVQKGSASMASAAENIESATKDIVNATPLLRLLGPAGKAVNFAEMGIGRIPGLLQRVFRRS